MKDHDQPLLITVQDGVATLSLNTPRTINALSETMLGDLQSALDDIAVDKAVRVVILRSTGAHFCAGHNLKEMTSRRADEDGGQAYYKHLFAQCSQMMLRIGSLPQPVIAEVRGIATAAGCQLVGACDLAVASDDARFATSGVNIGLFCSTPMVALSRNVSRKHALEMLLLGEFVSADRAEQMGLVNKVVPLDRLEAEVRAMAENIAGKSPAAIRMGKKAFNDQLGMTWEDAYAHAGRVMAENMMCQDAEAGIGAFVTKQPMPGWTGD